jgi:DNA polymerase I-like protein with 3'-5' exonuclease and polymerase domains
MSNEHIIRTVGDNINAMIEAGTLAPELQTKKFREMCSEFAVDAYDTYHERLPGIKETSRRASMIAKVRGFIFNVYGRRGHLPAEFSYRAFNRIVQSSAADVMKERLVALAPRYNAKTRELDIHIASNVHDENLDEMPLEILYDPKAHAHVVDTLQDTTFKFRVPMVTGLGISPNNWAEAAGKEVYRDDAGKFIAGRLK